MSAERRYDFDTLHFFGRMNVQLTHDMKNTVATISETAALVDEILGLSSHGNVHPKVPELSSRIVEQAQRCQTMLTRINGLAHLLDKPEQSADLAQLLDFSVALAESLPFARTVRFTPLDQSLYATISPFLFIQALLGCLAVSFTGLTSEQEVAMEAEHVQGTLRVVFTGLAPPDPEASTAAEFDPFRLEALEALNGHIDLDRDQGRLVLTLPVEKAGAG